MMTSSRDDVINFQICQKNADVSIFLPKYGLFYMQYVERDYTNK